MPNLDRDAILGCIPAEAPSGIAESTLDLLLKLDCYAKPGLSRAAFRELFVKCHRCEIVMTRRVMAQHDCSETFIDLTVDEENAAATRRVVIDLTADSDAEDST
jgi:hypothetical protein